MPLGAYCRPLALREFERGLRDLATLTGLVRAASAIALHEQPELADDDVIVRLDKIAGEVTRRAPSGQTSALVAHLHELLFDEMGLRGNRDDFYAADNSYLPLVIRRRRGIPISLCLVYAYIADRLGLAVQGINAPGHFLVAVETEEAGTEQIMFVDPFYGGTLLALTEVFTRIGQAIGREVQPSTELLAPASHSMWLARMLLNLQATFAQSGRERDVYAMQELQAMLEGEVAA